MWFYDFGLTTPPIAAQCLLVVELYEDIAWFNKAGILLAKFYSRFCEKNHALLVLNDGVLLEECKNSKIEVFSFRAFPSNSKTPPFVTIRTKVLLLIMPKGPEYLFTCFRYRIIAQKIQSARFDNCWRWGFDFHLELINILLRRAS